MRIKTKFSIPLVILIISLSVILNYLFIKSEEERLMSYITKFGVSLAKNLSSNSEFGVLIGSKAELVRPLEIISKEKDVVFAVVLDVKNRGKVLAHSDKNEIDNIYSDDYTRLILDADGVMILEHYYAPTSEMILDISVPILNEFRKKQKKESFDSMLEEDSDELFSATALTDADSGFELRKNGVARVGLSLTPLKDSIAATKKKMIYISLGMIMLMLLILTSVFKFITKPILTLVDAAKMISTGNYKHKVRITSNDEVGVLAKSFNRMSASLDQSMMRMKQRTNFNRSLISANNLKELLDTVLTEILSIQGIDDGAIMYYVQKGQKFLVRGTDTFYEYHKVLSENKNFLNWFNNNDHETIIEDYLEKFADDFAREHEEMQKLGVKMIIPMHAKDEIIGLFTFGRKSNGLEFDESAIRFLANLIQSAVIAIDNITLREKEAENEMLRYELEFAKRVQESLLPSVYPEMSGLDIHTLCMPAKDIGGDYYDFIELNEGSLGISIADVSGKGVPAALYMASTRGVLRSVALDDKSSHDTLSRINELMYEVCGDKTFVTMFYAVIDIDSKTLTYANAGHAFPLHYKDGVSGKSCAYLVNKGLPLGITSAQNYNSKSVVLQPGELILFYTDGIVEAMNEERELFGFDRLEELVKRHGHLSAKEFVEMTMTDLRTFIGETPLQDDLTLVAMRITN